MRREIVCELPNTGSGLIPQIIPVFIQGGSEVKTTVDVTPNRVASNVTSIDSWSRKVR